MAKVFLLTGTGTGVGKSTASLALCQIFLQKGFSVGYYKPVVCGVREVNSGLYDDQWIAKELPKLKTKCTYRLKTPCSPHLAAENEHVSIEFKKLINDLNDLSSMCDVIVVEGAGGVAVPLNRDGDDIASLYSELPGQIVLVALPGLGTINHVLTSQKYLESKGKKASALLFVEVMQGDATIYTDNQKVLNDLTRIPVLGCIPYSMDGVIQAVWNDSAMETILSQFENPGDLHLKQTSERPNDQKKSGVHSKQVDVCASRNVGNLFGGNAELDKWRSEGRYRRLQYIDSSSNQYVEIDGKKLLHLTSNDYLGLSQHPKVKADVCEAVKKWGSGSGASRLLGGSLRIHRDLEEKLAVDHGYTNALVMGGGFQANAGILATIAPHYSTVIADKLVHASLIDGMRYTSTPFLRFRHQDYEQLETLLNSTSKPSQVLVVVEALYSMDGDFSDFNALSLLQQKYGFTLYIDEAHSFGGYPNISNQINSLPSDKKIVLGTFGKALGSYGSFVCAPEEMIEYLINACRSFIFSTALPPACVAAAHSALSVIENNPSLISRLTQNINKMNVIIQSLGISTSTIQSHIVPIVLGSNTKTMQWADTLKNHGVWVGAVRPPTVPEGSARLRLSLRADLTDDDWRLIEQGLYRCIELSNSNDSAK